jgi:hypothetical protein
MKNKKTAKPHDANEVYIEWAAHVIAFRAVYGINGETSFRNEAFALAAFRRAIEIIRELKCI